MKENDIITLVMLNGAELIGRLVVEDMVNYTIYRPRLVQVGQQGLSLVSGVCMTGEEIKDNLQIPKNGVLFAVKTLDEIAKGWTSQTSGIALPTGGLVK